MKYPIQTITLLLTLFVLSGCYYDKKENLYAPQGGTNNCDTSAVTFAGKIQPILTASCVGCHAAGNASGGYALDTHSGVIAAQGRLLGAIKHSSGFSAMPQNAPKLGDCQISQIEKWITAGAPNN
jgi:cytochrome c553